MADIQNGGWLKTKKTYLVGIPVIVGAVIGYLIGDMNLTTALTAAGTALFGMFVRSDVKNMP